MSYTWFATFVSTPALVISGNRTTTMTEPFIATDYPVLIAWHSADLDDFTPASAPLLKAATSSPSSTYTSHTGQHKAMPKSSSGPTAGINAAISIGSLCGLLLLMVCWFLLSRMRRGHIERKQMLASHGPETTSLTNRVEADGCSIFEAESHPAEADHSHVRAELAGSWHGHELLEPWVLRETR